MIQAGYEQAYQQGFGRTVRFLCSRGVSMDNAEDLAQAAWLRGWQKLDQLRDEGVIVSWINAIAANYHRHGRQRRSSLPGPHRLLRNQQIAMLACTKSVPFRWFIRHFSVTSPVRDVT